MRRLAFKILQRAAFKAMPIGHCITVDGKPVIRKKAPGYFFGRAL